MHVSDVKITAPSRPPWALLFNTLVAALGAALGAWRVAHSQLPDSAAACRRASRDLTREKLTFRQCAVKGTRRAVIMMMMTMAGG